MDILDIFSWLPEKEMSLEEIEKITRSLYEGTREEGKYKLETELSAEADHNVVEATSELLGEGKQVCYLLMGDTIIAAIGYR